MWARCVAYHSKIKKRSKQPSNQTMGFVTGSSCFLHYSPLSSTAPSQCLLQPPFLFPFPRNALAQRKIRGAMMACLPKESPKDANICKRRMILFMGFAAFIPLLNLRADAIEAETELKPEDQKPKTEQPGQGNPFISLLNALGFLGSSVLAALYASASKEKATLDATIESMTIKLKEKDSVMTSLEKNFEADLLNEKEVRSKALAKATEEQQSLANQLKLANSTIKTLGQELQSEKRLAQELTVLVESLEVRLRKAGDEKMELQEQLKEKLNFIVLLEERINLLSLEIKDKEENLHKLKSTLTEKEREFNQLSSVYQESQEQVTCLDSDIKKLKDIIVKNEKELDLKNETVSNLNEELASLRSERDEFSKKLDATLQEYHHFKSSSEKKTTSDAKLLGERVEEIKQLEEQLNVALDEMSRNKEFIADLTQEKDGIRDLLNIELKNVKILEHELTITQNTLEKSKDEASDLRKQLEKSRKLCSELEAEISKVQAEFHETKEVLQGHIDEEKEGATVLAAELKSANDLLTKSNKELETLSQELAAAVQKSEILEKELAHVHTKAENAAHELKEEKKIITYLNKELKVLETQISKDKDARSSLEVDLEEATKSLDEMNRNTLMLSKDLGVANSRISSLEYEKDVLYMSLDKQKEVSKEARENLEDAHNLVMRLGKERESLEGRGKKLEEELGSAKGEILRLRSQINSSSAPATVKYTLQEKVDEGEKAAVPRRKVTRRRKVNTAQPEDTRHS